MPSAGFEPAVPTIRRPQAYAVDHTPINIGMFLSMVDRNFLLTSNSELTVSRERRDVGRTNSLENSVAFLLLKALVNGEVSIISQSAEYSLSAVSFLAAKHCVVKQDK